MLTKITKHAVIMTVFILLQAACPGMTRFLHLASSEVFELFWCQWLFSQQKQCCSATIPLALHLNQKTTIVHILFIQVVSEKLNRR